MIHFLHMTTKETFFYWVGVISIIYIIGRIVNLIAKRYGVEDITWAELFGKKKRKRK